MPNLPVQILPIYVGLTKAKRSHIPASFQRSRVLFLCLPWWSNRSTCRWHGRNVRVYPISIASQYFCVCVWGLLSWQLVLNFASWLKNEILRTATEKHLTIQIHSTFLFTQRFSPLVWNSRYVRARRLSILDEEINSVYNMTAFFKIDFRNLDNTCKQSITEL